MTQVKSAKSQLIIQQPWRRQNTPFSTVRNRSLYPLTQLWEEELVNVSKSVLLSAACILATGCAAPHPKSIRPMSISPEEYRGYSCEAMNAEQLALWKRKEDLRIPLKRAAEDFPLFGGTHSHAEIEREYAEKLGHLKAIETTAFAHECRISTEEELKAEYGLDGKTRSSWPSRD